MCCCCCNPAATARFSCSGCCMQEKHSPFLAKEALEAACLGGLLLLTALPKPTRHSSRTHRLVNTQCEECQEPAHNASTQLRPLHKQPQLTATARRRPLPANALLVCCCRPAVAVCPPATGMAMLMTQTAADTCTKSLRGVQPRCVFANCLVQGMESCMPGCAAICTATAQHMDAL